ncbi:gas vesicle protein GvpN [Brenneria uluponensis]|uniref:gas vesicle protein GvpN n=1 Tax=Brenneria uluponensis TaxID=3057057 RepID=UPI0028EEE46B|nr:gas vesicle protein GvpN [Brenneria ulupoensis]
MIKQNTVSQYTVDDDLVVPEASEHFVATSYVNDIIERALVYLRAGYPVHFAGPSGIGKTTLAFHLAALWGRPVTMLQGNEEFVSSDLTGKDIGYRKSSLVDNYIHSVLKTEEQMNRMWVDNRLTTACRNGDMLIYDEFNRSKAETNNVLLSVLSEGILNLPGLRGVGEGYLDVHPEFRAIFTSNPEEYAGTHKTQDALMDRMITINIGLVDRDTELQILHARSELELKEAAYIVDIIRELRGNEHETKHGLRAGIAIAHILHQQGIKPRYGDKLFHAICYDVLSMDAAKIQHAGRSIYREMVDGVIRKICPPIGSDTVKASAQKIKAVE